MRASFKKLYLIVLLGFLLSGFNVQAKTNEEILLKGFSALEQADFNQAKQEFDLLLKSQSEYKLALLIQAELLAIKAGRQDWIKQFRLDNKELTDNLFKEAKLRRQQERNGQKLLDKYVLKSSKEPYLVIVSAKEHRLYLFENTAEGLHQVADYYISIGRKGMGKQVRGDLRTPVGVYQIVKEMLDDELPELYGVAALTLDYPNQWDEKQGRTGSGIWLHGTPRTTYSRPPLDSRGCVVLNNPAMQELITKFSLSPLTPVIIVNSVKSEHTGVLVDKQTVLANIQQWLMVENNHQVNWQDVNVYQYPGEEGMYFVSFILPESNKMVEQYWQKELSNNTWKLVLEQKTKLPTNRS